MTPFITLLPIIIEVPGDLYLINKGRKDISLGVRLIMFVLVSIDYHNSTWGDIIIQSDFMLWCLAPYAFFDNILSIARWRSFKKWDKLGKTKPYDIFLDRFNPYILLFLRIVAFMGILLLAARLN